MWFCGRFEYVPRLAAHLWLGFDLKSTLKVLHRCDNPPCFNPKHIFIGTQSDNMRDCVSKKRHSQSKKTHCPKGHELVAGNLVRSFERIGFRYCLTCRRIQDRARARRRYELDKERIKLRMRERYWAKKAEKINA